MTKYVITFSEGGQTKLYKEVWSNKRLIASVLVVSLRLIKQPNAVELAGLLANLDSDETS